MTSDRGWTGLCSGVGYFQSFEHERVIWGTDRRLASREGLCANGRPDPGNDGTPMIRMTHVTWLTLPGADDRVQFRQHLRFEFPRAARIVRFAVR